MKVPLLVIALAPAVMANVVPVSDTLFADAGNQEAFNHLPHVPADVPEGDVATHDGHIQTNMEADPDNVMGMFHSMMSNAVPVPTPVSPYANGNSGNPYVNSRHDPSDPWLFPDRPTSVVPFSHGWNNVEGANKPSMNDYEMTAVRRAYGQHPDDLRRKWMQAGYGSEEEKGKKFGNSNIDPVTGKDIDPLTGRPWDSSDRKSGHAKARNADGSISTKAHPYGSMGYKAGDVTWDYYTHGIEHNSDWYRKMRADRMSNPNLIYDPNNPFNDPEVYKQRLAEWQAQQMGKTLAPTKQPIVMDVHQCYVDPRKEDLHEDENQILFNDEPSARTFCDTKGFDQIKSTEAKDLPTPETCQKVVLDPITSPAGTLIAPETAPQQHWAADFACTKVLKKICCERSHHSQLMHEHKLMTHYIATEPTAPPTVGGPPMCTIDNKVMATSLCCGDFVCDAGEDLTNCPTDCIDHTLASVQTHTTDNSHAEQFASPAPTPAPTKAPTTNKACFVGSNTFPDGYHGQKDPTCDYVNDRTCYLEYCLLCDCQNGVFTCDATNCGGPFSCYKKNDDGSACDESSTISTEMLKDIHECRQVSCSYIDKRVVTHHKNAEFMEAKYHRCGYNSYNEGCTCLCWHTDKYVENEAVANEHTFSAFKEHACDDVRFTSIAGQELSFVQGKGEVRVIVTMSHPEAMPVAHIPQLAYVEHSNLTHFTVCVQNDVRLGADLPIERTLKINYLAWQGDNDDRYGAHPFPGAASGDVMLGDGWNGKDTFCQNVPFNLNWQVEFQKHRSFVSDSPSADPFASFTHSAHTDKTPDPVVIGGLQSALPSVVSWIESVTKTEFRVCMRNASSYMESAEPMTVEDFSDRRLEGDDEDPDCKKWGAWSTCSKGCDTGVRTRQLMPGLVKADGSPCICEPGICHNKETQSCNEHTCPSTKFVWFAFQNQKNGNQFIHFAAAGSEPSAAFEHTLNGVTQHVYLSCKVIAFPDHFETKFTEPPLVFAIANHEQTLDNTGHSVSTWLDTVTTTNFKVCSVELHDAKIPNYKSELMWDWVAFDKHHDKNVGEKFKSYAELRGKKFKNSNNAGAADEAGKAYAAHMKQVAFWRSMKEERNAQRVAEIKQHIEDLKKNPAVEHIAAIVGVTE